MRIAVYGSGRVTGERAAGARGVAVLAEGGPGGEHAEPLCVLQGEKVLVLRPGALLVLATALRPVRGGGWVAWEVAAAAAVSLRGGDARRLPAVEELFAEGGWYCGEGELSAREGGEARPQFVFNWSTWSDPALRPWSACLVWGFFGSAAGLRLAARRATGGAGTRYRRRGAAAGGHAANFVELEQIVGRCSYVQLRGSVPLSWSQDCSGTTLAPAIVLAEDEERQRQLLAEHVAQLQQEYGRVAVVSLLKHGDAEEAHLHRSFSRLLTRHADTQFFEFDLHRECGRDGFAKLQSFAASLPISVSPKQELVLRANCKDSVDRTGLLQSAVFQVALPKQQQVAGVASGGAEAAARGLMAECNSRLSVAYCGTGAVREEIAWGAEHTSFLGRSRDKLLGLLRLFCAACLDEEKQWALDALAGDDAALSELEEREKTASWLWRARPRLAQGFVAGPLHLLSIILFLLVFFLFLRGKK